MEKIGVSSFFMETWSLFRPASHSGSYITPTTSPPLSQLQASPMLSKALIWGSWPLVLHKSSPSALERAPWQTLLPQPVSISRRHTSPEPLPSQTALQKQCGTWPLGGRKVPPGPHPGEG